MRQRVLFVLFVLLLVTLLPRSADAQVLLTWVANPPKNTDLIFVVGAAVPVASWDRLSLRVGGSVGAIFESADARQGRQAHVTWMALVPVVYRIGESWGIMAGYGHGWVRRSAKPPLQNYNTLIAGIAIGGF